MEEVKATVAVVQQRAPLMLGTFLSPVKKTPTLRRIGVKNPSASVVKQHIGHRQIMQYSADRVKELTIREENGYEESSSPPSNNNLNFVDMARESLSSSNLYKV